MTESQQNQVLEGSQARADEIRGEYRAGGCDRLAAIIISLERKVMRANGALQQMKREKDKA